MTKTQHREQYRRIKRKISALMAALLLALLAPALALAADFSASGLTLTSEPQQLGKPQDRGSARVSVSLPGENPSVAGVNPITGEPYAGAYQPVLVNIDTHPGALPHWGVSAADLIYEMPIQADGSTRSLAVFMSEYPASAGPIR